MLYIQYFILNTAGKLHRLLRYIAIALLCFGALITNAQDLVHYVQPLSGTAPSTAPAALKHSEAGSERNANTIPAVGMPFGMTQWTPQTRLTENKCIPPYFYKDSLLTGFRGTHWLSGSCTQDYGSFTIMPVTASLRTTAAAYAVPFSHNNETTSPAYYKIDLPVTGLRAEMTATPRCGVLRFTMLRSDSLYILITPNSDQAKGSVRVDAARGTVSGTNPVHRIYQGWGQPAGFSGCFFMQFNRPFTVHGAFAGAQLFSQNSVSGKKDAGIYIGFKLNMNESLEIRVGTSFTDELHANENLQVEIHGKKFDVIAAQAKQQWQQALEQIAVKTNIEKDKYIFYTAMYHAMQHPRLYSNTDGTYPAFAGKLPVQKINGAAYYDDFSMWDIYRAQLPLLEILQPQLVNSFVQSLVLKGQEGGWLPIFPCWNSYTAAMIGDHSVPVIASAYAKGIRNYDLQAAYSLMRKNAFEVATTADYKNGMGRRALNSYIQYGYIPMEDSVPEAFHKKEQVSRTLEYAYDDYALSVMAKGLQKDADHKTLKQRSYNYRNVFDTGTGMVRGRYANGSWYAPFNADQREPYITEGTPRQYSFYVPHDVPGLVKLMGGPAKLEQALDSLFMKEAYWHGNEPGHQIPFMYNYTASPWKTQAAVRKILATEYSDGPGGLSGNDDAGQMSAWYVFAALGFYPVDPVSGEYLLTTPLFEEVILKLPNGKKLQIVCRKHDAKDVYIKSIIFNGKPYRHKAIRYKDIMQGGRLEFLLTDKNVNFMQVQPD